MLSSIPSLHRGQFPAPPKILAFLLLVKSLSCINLHMKVFAFWGPFHFHILVHKVVVGAVHFASALYVAPVWKSPSSVCCHAKVSCPLSIRGGGCSRILNLMFSGSPFIQVSSQKLVESPSPTYMIELSWNTSHSFTISFHRKLSPISYQDFASIAK